MLIILTFVNCVNLKSTFKITKMPSPIDPRSMDLYATPHTASPKECRNEQGTVVHMRHLAAGEETRLPRNSVNTPNGISVNIARDGMEGLEDRTAASDDDNIIDDIASVGVEGREELGTVPDELSQYQSSNNVEGLVTLNQNEDEDNETKQNVIVEMIMRGYNPIRVQSAVDAILSNDPNATLTPVAVEHNLQERSLSQEGSENVVMVGAG